MNTEFPLISVIVITYDHEPYIAQCIESILQQHGDFRLEIVISNDCSSDHTHQIIEQKTGAYRGPHQIRYFHQEHNLGIVPNFLFTWRQCRGDYIAICEGDDYWRDTKKLQKQLTLFRQQPACSMVITDRLVLHNDGTANIESYSGFYKKEIFDTSDIINDFIPGTQTIMIRHFSGFADFLNQHQALTHCDRYLAYYASLHGTIVLLPEVTAAYRLTGQGAWSKNTSLQKKQVKVKQLEDFHHRIGLPHNNAVLASHILSCAFITLKYCIKRPAEWKKPDNKYWIWKSWRRLKFINKIKLLYKVIVNK